jgi:hypothetical protein
MNRSLNNEDRLAQYLLGLMPEQEMIELEEIYLLDDDLNKELQAVERDLMDRYLEGSLSEKERARFENFFLSSPGRIEKLRLSRILKAYGSKLELSQKNETIASSPKPRAILNFFAGSYVGIAAVIILAIALGLVAWSLFFFSPPQQQAMLALSKAYSAGRLFESRISGLDYVPMAQARGDSKQNLDTMNLTQAELIALKEAADHPGGASFHTAGRVYLAQQRFDEAMQWLRKAAEAAPKDAQIQSDLAAALLENARQNPNPEKRAEELTECYDRLSKALEINHSLPEAHFNRALWYEYMHLPEQAEAEWQSYLQKDSRSGWADEARRRLKLLEEKRSRSYVNRDGDFDDFVVAATTGDKATAWNILSRNRDRTSNAITQRLIDEYIESAEQRRAAEASARLRLISLAGRLEYERAGDRFTADLASYYLTISPAQRKLLAQARGLLKSGFASYGKAEYEKATHLYRQARRLFTQAGNEYEAAVAESYIGACLL